jgi:hypothetical protein
MSSRILAFPLAGQPTTANATRWQVLKSRFALAVAGLLHRMGVPGTIAPVSINDALTGQRLEITVDPFFTCVSVDGRDYYFCRFTGRFDGTGVGCG